MATPYEKGKNLENYIARRLREKEFFVARSAGSKGVFDLIAIPPLTLKTGKRLDRKTKIYGIQVKANGNFSRKDIKTLIETGKRYRIIPVIAYKEGRKIVLKYAGNKNEVPFW